MKKVLAFLMLVVLALSLCSCGKEESKGDIETIKEAGVIRIGMECNYAPFNWLSVDETETSEKVQSGGYADGYDVYFSTMIGEALGVEVEIVQIEWDGLVPALQAGTIDLIVAGMSPTSKRKLSIDFTDDYYYGNKAAIMRTDSKYVDAKTLEDLAGASVTAQIGSANISLFDQLPDSDCKLIYDNNPAILEAIRAGEVDIFLEDEPVGIGIANSNSDLCYVVLPFELEAEDAAVSVGCRKGSDLTEFVNTVLAGVSDEQRTELMTKAVLSQPSSE